MGQFGILVVLAMVLLGAQELFRRSGQWLAWACFLAVPILATPTWIVLNAPGLFAWVKLYSVLFTTCWITALRYTNLGGQPWARSGALLLLLANIGEAVIADALSTQWAHRVNALAGGLLIAALWKQISVVSLNHCCGHQDLHLQGMTRGWLLGYCLWNWVFVDLNYPIVAEQQVAVLAASLAAGLLEPRRWLQARSYTLAVDLILMFSFPSRVLEWSQA